MLSEAYELFGCNTADLYVIAVNTGDTDAECIQFDQTYGVDFPCISGVEGGGTAINSTYGIGAYPTYILIAPNHDIVEQDMWPISNVGTFINYFQSNGLQQAECGAVLTAVQKGAARDEPSGGLHVRVGKNDGHRHSPWPGKKKLLERMAVAAIGFTHR